ncbi:toll-like receptor 2 [Mytilus californianus]|uniref:toll-like receptor 2 n=1 Tax=Mytilus californianus TaxID=6549 RepID=UPI002246439A|nr:toll-like receptor 2 [Mytilus californianus]
MRNFDILTLFLLMLCFHAGSSKTCRIKEIKKKIIADCTRIELHNIPKYLPLNISELDLSYNDITLLRNNAFKRFGFMEVLKIDNMNLGIIETETFYGLTKLKWLSMKKNKFNMSSINFKRVFKPLSSLNHLDIRYNLHKQFIKTTIEYPFFGDLLELKYLYMDLAQKPVLHESGFELLLNLHTIRFEKCYLDQMLNDTLINLPSNIIALHICGCGTFIPFVESGFLKPFPALMELNMIEANIKLADALKLLFPFTGREMTSITYERIKGSAEKPTFITCDMMKYLKEICVHTLVLAESDIVGYEQNSLLAFKYPNCLEYLVFSGNRFSLAYGHNLMELVVFAKKTTNLKFIDLSYNAINFNDVKYCNIEALRNDSFRNEIYSKGCEVQSTDARTFQNSNSNRQYSRMTAGSNMTISLPVNLTFLRLSHYMTSYMEYGLNFFLKNSASLRYIDISYLKVSYFPEIYSDTPFDIKYLDFTGVSAMLFIHKSSVPIFKNIETAILKDSMIDETIRKNGNIFKLFPTVEKFDISYNNVFYLDDDSFSFNTRLKNLNMANNLLPSIPKALMSLEHLNKLDIRYNRIQTIGKTLRTWLDAKRESGKFHLLIKGNSFKCTCETADFIEWLFKTEVSFDQTKKQYNCTLANGTETNTLVVYSRFHDHFGNCYSTNWLRLGIGLLISFAVVTIPFAIIFNFRWKIIYLVYRNFKKVVEKRLEKKFTYDIYLACADDKIQWVSDVLLQQFECSWKMKVCLEHRDFPVGVAKADAIANAVAESKHAIFIISEIYQDRGWSRYEIERVEYEKCSNDLQKIVVIVRGERVSCILREFNNIQQHLTIIEWTDDETGYDKLRMTLFTESF